MLHQPLQTPLFILLFLFSAALSSCNGPAESKAATSQPTPVQAQTRPTASIPEEALPAIEARDSAIFERYKEKATREQWQKKPISEIITLTGDFFIGTPYVGQTLETDYTKALKEGTNVKERLIINLHEMDCMTFMENILALARTVRLGDISLDAYCRQLCLIRYRQGRIDGYASRLHYTSDWIRDNESLGIARDITLQIGGIPREKKRDWMSNHPQLYDALRMDPSLIKDIRKEEERLSQTPFNYIPRNRIDSTVLSGIQDGDMITFTAEGAGIDYAHVGFAHLGEDGILHFKHCSLTIKHALTDKRSIPGYMSNKKHFDGMAVFRATDPLSGN